MSAVLGVCPSCDAAVSSRGLVWCRFTHSLAFAERQRGIDHVAYRIEAVSPHISDAELHTQIDIGDSYEGDALGPHMPHGRRYDGDADRGGDQIDRRRQLRCLLHDARLEPAASAGGDDGIGKPRSLPPRKADEVLAREIRQRDRLPRRQAMAEWNCDHHRIACQHLELDRAAGGDRRTDEAYVQLSLPQPLCLRLGGRFLELELDARPLGPEGREGLGDHRAERCRFGKADAQASDMAARDLARKERRSLDLREHGPRFAEKGVARLGQDNTAAGARE